jgi:hypothetical protein
MDHSRHFGADPVDECIGDYELIEFLHEITGYWTEERFLRTYFSTGTLCDGRGLSNQTGAQRPGTVTP